MKDKKEPKQKEEEKIPDEKTPHLENTTDPVVFPEDKKTKKYKPGIVRMDKEKAKLDFYDPRGVQTLFRTLSRNHYNLLRMIDTKASIVLTMNSIIISLLMGVLYVAPESDREIIRVSAKFLIHFSMSSMIFALISMLPHRYFGKLFKNSNYKGSLYAGNFANQTLDEFQAEFERIMSNGNMVYDEMIKDLYFLGKVISHKHQMLVLSVGIFLVGLVLATILSISNGFPMF